MRGSSAQNLATSENWRDKNTGERRERTEWHRVVIFNERLVEVAEKYLRKGSKIYAWFKSIDHVCDLAELCAQAYEQLGQPEYNRMCEEDLSFKGSLSLKF